MPASELVQLPAEPPGWSIDSANAERLQAVAAFGFTDRQARFLLEVLLHSGVFLERQYCQFAGIAHGQKTTNFIRSLVDRRLATPITPGKLHRGRMFHLHYKPLWTALDEADSRFRKRAAPGRMIERVMLLDAVLDDPALKWIGPSIDKRSLFIRAIGEKLSWLEFPRVQFGSGASVTNRYFPDKLPIGVHPEFHDRPVFLYLVSRPSPWDFRLFLLRHIPLLQVLSHWTIRLLFPRPLAKARHAHLHAVREHLATTLDGNAGRLDELFRERLRLSQPNPEPPSQRYGNASVAFDRPRFRAIYQQWLTDPKRTIEMADSRALAIALERGLGRIECVDLTRQYLHLSPLVDVA
jgi:hypothetical protein